MACVVAERNMPEPVTLDGVRGMIRDGKWCNDLYGVSHRGSLLAPDRRRLICFYDAPDAESVRTTGRRSGAPVDRIWSATVIGAAGVEPLTARPATKSPDLPAATVLVLRAFDAPTTIEELESRTAPHGWCYEAHTVRHLQSFLSNDRRRMLCLFAAPDAESVRLVQQQTGIPYAEIWTATLCCP